MSALDESLKKVIELLNQCDEEQLCYLAVFIKERFALDE